MPIKRILEHPRLIAFFFLAVLLVAAFSKIIFQGQTFNAAQIVAGVTPVGPYGYPGNGEVSFYTFGGDPPGSGWQIVAEGEKVFQELSQGKLPLWNPNQMFGARLAHNMQLSPFFPLKGLLLANHSLAMWDFYKLLLFFIAGYFTYLYLALIPLRLWSSLIGAASYTLSGVMVMYAHFSFMDVYSMLPVLLYTVERWIRTPSARNLAFTALAFGFTFLSGYPVPVFLAVFFVSSYAVYRLFSLKESKRAGVLSIGVLLGAGLGALMLLPGINTLLNSETTRPPGVGLGVVSLKYFYASLIPYVLTKLKPEYYDVWCGWHGIIPTILAALVIFAKPKPIVIFFSVFTVLGYLKLGGIAPVQWIAHLPFFSRIIYTRYLHPELALSVAILAGFGAEKVLRQEVDWRRVGMIAFGIFALCAGLYLSQKNLYQEWSNAPLLRLAVIGMALTAWTVVPRYGLLLLLFVAVELAGYAQANRNLRYDPFTPAPYVTYLKSLTDLRAHQARTFALNGILHPPYSSAYDIDDGRWINAVYFPHYKKYVNEFLSEKSFDRMIGDEADLRFFGDRGGLSKFLDLANVKYILTNSTLDSEGNLGQRIFRYGIIKAPNGPNLGTMEVNGVSRLSLYQAPPSDIEMPIKLRDDVDALEGFLALDPKTWDPGKGDGVEFSLALGNKTVFKQYVDPKNRKEDRRWIPFKVDLKAYRGKNITLHLKTGLGPKDNGAWDWSAWGDLHFTSQGVSHSPLKLIYDQDIKIYENTRALPRAFLVYATKDANTDDDAVRIMKSPAFDPRTLAVVQNAPELTLKAGAGEATIVSYDSSRVVVKAKTSSTGFLVLSDTFDPHWKAHVDGQVVPVYRTDLNFRGLVLEAGEHTVTFTYQDRWLEMSVLISAISLSGIAFLACYRRRMGKI